MTNILTVMSVVDDKHSTSDRLNICQDVLKKQGFTTYLGIDDNWKGLRSKITFYTNAIRELDTQYVMFLDALDVIVLGGPDKVMEKYLSFNHPWVYSTERNIWPPSSFKEECWLPSDSPYRYLNSGGYIGDREYIISQYEKWTDNWTASYDEFTSEQFWVTRNYMKDRSAIKLDTDCELFQSMCGAYDCIITPGQVYNPETEAYPLIIHFNGGVDVSKKPSARKLWESIL